MIIDGVQASEEGDPPREKKKSALSPLIKMEKEMATCGVGEVRQCRFRVALDG